MFRVSTPTGTAKAAAIASDRAVTPPATAAAPLHDAVAGRVTEPAAARARVHQAAERYRNAAAELEERRQERQAAVLHAKSVGASAHHIAEAAGISDQRMAWILANCTRPRQPQTKSDLPVNRRSGNAAR
jgi:hypothetical protein